MGECDLPRIERSARTGRSCATAASTPTPASTAASSTGSSPWPPSPRRRRRRALPHARRVGAARGHLARLAAQPLRLARQLRPDPLGLRRDRAPARRGRAGADPRAVDGTRRRPAHPRPRRRSTERVEFFRWPTDRGWTRDFGPICVRREGAGPRSRSRAAASTAGPSTRPPQGRQVPERVARALALKLRAGGPTAAGPSCSRAAPSTSTAGHDPRRPRSACSTRRPGAQPRLRARRLRGGVRPTSSAPRTRSGSARASPATTPTVTSTTCARFVNDETIVLCAEPRGDDANHGALAENRERLQDARLADGAKPDVVDAADAARRSSSTASGCPRATRTSTSPTAR